MPNIFIIHGSEGNPNENWFPWLKKQLEDLGHKVHVPAFPTPENQTFGEWMKIWHQYGQFLDENSIVIGHSLGVLFLLSVLEKAKVKAAFFVAGFAGLPGNRFDDGMKTFARDFDFEKIKNNCQRFFVYHSDNDPYVKLDVAQNLAEQLDVKVSLIKNAGHFNEDSGYDKFPLILDRIGDGKFAN